MTYKLFLDDERFPVGDDCIIARSFAEACAIVEARGIPEFVSFDHDLGSGPTGKDFARWLVDFILDHPDDFRRERFGFYVHSQNPVGAENIRSLMAGFLAFHEENNDV